MDQKIVNRRTDGSRLIRKSIRIGGRLYQEYFSRKTDAQIWYAEKRREKELVRAGVTPSLKETTIKEFYDGWILRRKVSEKKSENTTRNEEQRFKDYIIPACGSRFLHHVPQEEWEDFLADVMKEHELSNATINRMRSTLHKFYEDAKSRKVAIHNPIGGIKPLPEDSDRHKFFETKEDCQKYLAAAAQDYCGTSTFANLSLNLGTRFGETLALHWSDVDLSQRRLHVWQTMDYQTGKVRDRTKNKKGRWLGINDDLFSYLVALKNSTKWSRPNDFVVCDDEGKSFRTRVRRAHERVCKRAGLKIIRIHDMRHTYASHFIMNGGTLVDLMGILGHSSPKMVLRYAHLAPGYLATKANTVSFSGEKLQAEVIELEAHR